MFKQNSSFILVVIIFISLAACGKKEEEDNFGTFFEELANLVDEDWDEADDGLYEEDDDEFFSFFDDEETEEDDAIREAKDRLLYGAMIVKNGRSSFIRGVKHFSMKRDDSLTGSFEYLEPMNYIGYNIPATLTYSYGDIEETTVVKLDPGGYVQSSVNEDETWRDEELFYEDSDMFNEIIKPFVHFGVRYQDEFSIEYYGDPILDIQSHTVELDQEIIGLEASVHTLEGLLRQEPEEYEENPEEIGDIQFKLKVAQFYDFEFLLELEEYHVATGETIKHSYELIDITMEEDGLDF